MVIELTEYKSHASLNKAQKDKISSLLDKKLYMRDKDIIETYYENTLNLVAEFEARAKSETIKEK